MLFSNSQASPPPAGGTGAAYATASGSLSHLPLALAITVVALVAAVFGGATQAQAFHSAPNTTITTPLGVTADATPTFSFSASGVVGTASFECKVDFGAYAPCSSPKTIGPLTSGSHTFNVRATATVCIPMPFPFPPLCHSTTDPSPASDLFIVDTVDPTVNISSPAPGAIVGPSVDIVFTASDNRPGVTTGCRLGGLLIIYFPCTSPKTYTFTTTGPRTAYVRATDAVGNTSVDSVAFTVDADPPVTSITSGPASSTTDTSATYVFSANEAATFKCQLDGGAYAPCSSPHTVTGLAVGTHTLNVQATDSVGNVGTPATYTHTVVAPPGPATPATPAVPATPAAPVTPVAKKPCAGLRGKKLKRCRALAKCKKIKNKSKRKKCVKKAKRRYR